MRYFVTSDIHSHYQELINKLSSVGYDKSNLNHTLIVCGDIFDRGDEAKDVYLFLRSIPSSNLILIKGNHDYLFCDLYEKDEASDNDIEDGTLATFINLVGKVEEFKQLKEEKIIKEVYEWIKSDKWLNYYEMDKYIFVHSFIPLRFKEGCTNYDDPDIYHDLYYDKDWREIKDEFLLRKSAFDSSWRKVDANLFNEEAKKGKILVSGHTHSYEFYRGLDKKIYKNNDFDFGIYFSSRVINLDGNVEKSGIINVLVIDESFEIIK